MHILVRGVVLTGVLLTCISCSRAPAGRVPEVLVQGAPIHGTNGIIFDGNDRLYIGSVAGREIVVMDPETGVILERIGTDRGVDVPDDLHFGPDGSLYWTAIFTGVVGRLTPDGAVSVQKIQPGVNPITFSTDGRLFVGCDVLSACLYELDPELRDPPRLIMEGRRINGMDWGPDGRLYAPAGREILAIDVSTGSVSSVAANFGWVVSVKFDSEERLHTLDYVGQEVVRLNPETDDRETVVKLPPGSDNIAFDSRDRLYISNFWDGSILEALPDGTTRTVSPGGMIIPGGIAVHTRPSGGESVFVSDMFTTREYDGATGDLIRTGSSRSHTVSIDGYQFVTSTWMGGWVDVWDLQSDTRVVRYADFNMPINATLFQGDLIVADVEWESGYARVVRASLADASQRRVLLETDGGLGLAAGLAATADDLWIGDRTAGTVLQIVAGGEDLTEPTVVAQGLTAPEGMAISPDGSLLVVETGAQRLVSVDPATGEVSTVVAELSVDTTAVPGFPRTWMFSGVAVGPSGAIYLTSFVDNQLLVLRPEG